MNVEELVRDSLRDLAGAQEPVAPGFADRVLAVRRRRRTRTFASVAAATAAVVAVSVAVPQLVSGGRDDVRPSRVTGGHSLPVTAISAGRTVAAAYYTTTTRKTGKGEGVTERTYRLLDPGTGRYKKDTRWSYVAVAPGAKTAAVLERTVPASRFGLLDLTTGKVKQWIDIRMGLGGLSFSHDGTKLVLTTYDKNPDHVTEVKSADGGANAWMADRTTSRTGYMIFDMVSHNGAWWQIKSSRDVPSRADFAFTDDDKALYARIIGGSDGMEEFYNLSGKKITAPAKEKYLRWDVPARISPNGELAALGLTKEVNMGKKLPGKSYSSIRNPLTGKEITKVRGGHLLAWVDDKRLIAWERTTPLKNAGYKDHLVLVTIGSDKVVVLSGERDPDDGPPNLAWEPVFAER
ncbi:WD40 repeat domain-containing protein [Streptomyces aquilus]|uniref:WD40 repeat domain-containing protein n=1 Tax=Streptomyces aquilus TaxID=2548456 RepID=A0A3Q9BUE5_9ACTN|nr:WD40 repeat domain-containing protein [Streptomyces aquilus]AZP16913.1 WD40 repeat domain-containing protein [Streptomyces aquilus]